MPRATLSATIALAAAFLLAAPTAARAQLFKCIQDGRTVYQQEKCPDTAKESRIREPDAVPEKPLDPKAAGEKAVQQATAEVDRLVDVIAGFSICGERVPEFREKYGGAFEDWKTRNVEAFGRFGSNPEASRKLDLRLQAERAKPASDSASDCARVVGAIQPGRGTR
jgi:hypothetical protein